MIRIKGYVKKPKIMREFICDFCGCVYDADEESYMSANQQEDADGIAYTCKCPNCKMTNYIDKRR